LKKPEMAERYRQLAKEAIAKLKLDYV
jgi:hypothetical protein